MKEIKTKAITNIEEKMSNLEAGSLRYEVLETAKKFKTSWIDLGQILYTVWKDRLYKEWGYGTFEVYTAKEIGIRKDTAMRLLKSYSFLEKEEPLYLQKHFIKDASCASVPTYESVDLLRKAKNNKNIDEDGYTTIKKYVLETGKDAKDVKKDLTQLIRKQEELSPEDAWKTKRLTIIKRLLSTLKSLQEEIKITKMLPVKFINEMGELIDKLEEVLS